MMFPNKQIKAPLFRDPIFDGASDPTVLWVEEEQCYYMFYTQRRAAAVNFGVSYIHGSQIGLANSTDGEKWLYRGTVPGLEIEPGHNTFWAPEVIYAKGQYHMYVSYITGVPCDWEYDRKILHYTASDIWHWHYEGALDLASSKVIDACVFEVEEGVYKLWYKDEERGSKTYGAVSRDLFSFQVTGEETGDCCQEGPNVFAFGGKIWLIADYWKGLAVYRRGEDHTWIRCEDILGDSSKREMDGPKGHHADVLVEGENAWIFYFCHPYAAKEGEIEGLGARTVIQAARLLTDGSNLYCLRDC